MKMAVPSRRRCYFCSSNHRLILGCFFIICLIISISRIQLSSKLLNDHKYQNDLEDSDSFIQPIIIMKSTKQEEERRKKEDIVEDPTTLLTSSSSSKKHQQHNNIIKISNNSNNNQTTATTKTKTTLSTNTTLSICLLLKDDNDILNEWIAYHYHTLNLRHMIVAIDPYSLTSPQTIFDMWTSKPYWGMKIEIWNDTHYMPNYFLSGNYDKVPSFIPQRIKDNSIWHQNQQDPNDNSITKNTTTTTTTTTTQKLSNDLIHINNHRFRQVTFVSKCYEALKKKSSIIKKGNNKSSSSTSTWVAHIDTDEYITINSNIITNPNIVEKKGGGVKVPMTPHEGSIMKFLEDMLQYYPKRLLPKKCIMMPSLLFGGSSSSKEEEDLNNHDDDTSSNIDDDDSNNNSNSIWNKTKFETLRWKYHANYTDIINGLQKSIVDVSRLPHDHKVFLESRIFSVHQPLDKPDCRRYTIWPNFNEVRLYPLTINHYLGSKQRYLSRSDIRRNVQIYEEKSMKGSSVIANNNWIQGWLSSFIEKHQYHATEYVLKDYMKEKKRNTKLN